MDTRIDGIERQDEIEITLLSASLEGRASRRTLLRHGLKAGLSLSAVAALVLMRGDGASAKKASPIPPNCIYVCCDETCDTFCYRCVTWPKPPKKVVAR